MNWLFEDEYPFKVVSTNLAQDYWRKWGCLYLLVHSISVLWSVEYVVYESIYYGLQLSWDSSWTLLGYSLKCKLLLPILVLRPSTMLLPMLLRNSFGYLNFSDNSKSVFLLLPDFYATKTMLFSLLPTRWPNLAPKILILTIISFGNLLLKRLLVSALSPHTSSWLMFIQKEWPDYSFYWIVASCAFFHHANFEGDIRGKSDSSDNNQDISDSPWL